MKYWCYTYDQEKESFTYYEQNLEESLKSTQVKIRPMVVGVCGSDLKQISLKLETPRIGHEWVGVIESVGDKVTDFKVGEKVISLAHICCEECDLCLSGDYKDCTNRQLLGGEKRTVLSSSIILQESDLLKVPQNLEFKDLALLEVAFIGDTAYSKALSIGLQKSDRCLIFGAGPIGIFTALALKLRGHDVTIVELKKERLQSAAHLGLNALHYAKVILNNRLHGQYDAIFDCSGDNHGEGALKVLPVFSKINSILVIVGKYSKAKLDESHYAGKSLKVTWVANHEKSIFEETIKFWSNKIQDYTSIVGHLYTIDDIDLAFKDSFEGKHIKNLIQVN